MRHFFSLSILLLNVTAAFITGLLTLMATRGGFWFSTPRPSLTNAEWANLAFSRFTSALPLIVTTCVISFAINYGLWWLAIHSSSIEEKRKRVKKMAFHLALALLLLLMVTSICESGRIYITKPSYVPF